MIRIDLTTYAVNSVIVVIRKINHIAPLDESLKKKCKHYNKGKHAVLNGYANEKVTNSRLHAIIK